MRKVLGLLTLALTLTLIADAQTVSVKVKNSLDKTRFNEMAEVDLALVRKAMKAETTPTLIVTDADGKEIASQVTYDDKIIFPVGVAAKGSSTYFIKVGTPKKYEQKVFGRYFPERVDDIAWENDRVAFRTYGPALQANNEKAYGIDVWNKRTSQLVIEQRYAGELDPNVTAAIKKLREMGKGDLADDVYNAVSYHVDHGNGMDCYKVGSTLGCGTPALLNKDGNIVYPWCWKGYEILDNGPLRFTVKLVYNSEKVDDLSVVETRIISLDAGSHLNKCTVSYFDVVPGIPVCAGIVVHKENPTAYVINEKDGYIGYEDLGDSNQYKEKYRATQNKDFGQIYVGTVFPQKGIKTEYKEDAGLPGANGHLLGVGSIDQKTGTFTYYFGSGWSRNTETGFTSLAKWEEYLSEKAKEAKSPLKVEIR